MMIMKKICSLYLVFLLISFVGFLYEYSLAYMLNYDLDRNFLNLPICPIYGSGVIISYLVFDTPKNMRIFNYKIKYNHKIKLYLYFLFTSISATILEYIIGTYFEKVFDIVLWNYNELLFTFNKYCSLIPSIGWGILITIFMNIYFDRIYSRFYNYRLESLIIITLPSLIFILIDLIFTIF